MTGEIGKNASTLRHMRNTQTDNVFGRHTVDAFITEPNRPARESFQSGNSPQGCALAGAVSADDGHHGSLPHFHANPFQRGNFVVVDGRVLDPKQHRPWPPDKLG